MTQRKAEVRVIHVLILLVVVGAIGTVAAAFVGWVSIGWLNKKNLEGALETGVQTASGYTPAKTPVEAMDKFREAIHARNYKAAKKYTTKSYADMLERSHDAASDMGRVLDKIRNFGNNKDILNDRTRYALYQLDPFPTNFGSDKPPTEKDGKAYGRYKWEPLKIKATPAQLAVQMKPEFDNFDKDMYQTVLAPPLIFTNQIELVKEGEEWKLNIPTNPQWETAVAYYIDNYKRHHTGLSTFADELSRQVIDNPGTYERLLFDKLRAAKNS